MKKTVKFLLWFLFLFNLFNTSIIACQTFILDQALPLRSIHLLITFFYFFNPDASQSELEIILKIIYGEININNLWWGPYIVQKRSDSSFIILTILSYSFFILSFKLILSKITIKRISFGCTLLLLSCWFQFLSVQYIGVGYYTNKASIEENMICEYYSIWELRKSTYNFLTECYNYELYKRTERIYIENNDFRFIFHDFFNCHEIKEDNIFINAFTKKYYLKPNESMQILNGIGPLFKLNAEVKND